MSSRSRSRDRRERDRRRENRKELEKEERRRERSASSNRSHRHFGDFQQRSQYMYPGPSFNYRYNGHHPYPGDPYYRGYPPGPEDYSRHSHNREWFEERRLRDRIQRYDKQRSPPFSSRSSSRTGSYSRSRSRSQGEHHQRKRNSSERQDADRENSRSNSPEKQDADQGKLRSNAPEKQDADRRSSRRVTTSNPQDKEKTTGTDDRLDGNEENNEKTDEPLNEKVQEALGKRVNSEKPRGPALHKDLAARWQEIKTLGLPKDERATLIEKYPVPENCQFFIPPKLNPIFLKALKKEEVERDKRIAFKHVKLGLGLTAIGQSLEWCLKQPESDEMLSLIGWLGDTARCLADLQHDEVIVRRGLVVGAVGKDAKDPLLELPWHDEWLFGEELKINLADDQGASKKTLELLKPTAAPTSTHKKQGTKNSKPPQSKDYALRSGGAKKSDWPHNHRSHNRRRRSSHQDERKDWTYRSSRRR